MPDLSSRLAVAMATALIALPAAAADPAAGWPTSMPPGWGTRGSGGGLAILPAVLPWIVILAWMRSVDWVSRDATRHKITPAFWGTACGLPLFIAAVISWWIPSVWAGLAIMVIAWIAPLVAYSLIRNKSLPPAEHVLTASHARRVMAGLLAPLGIAIDAGADEGEVIPKVVLAAAGGKDAAENAARLEAAMKMPGFEEARKTLLGAVMGRASTMVVSCDPVGMAVRHEIDGVWEKPRIRQPPKNRKELETWVEAPKSSLAVGNAVIAALKTLCGLPPGAVETKPVPFLLQVDDKPRNCRLSVRPQPNGEQLVIQLEPPVAVYKKFADLGMPGPLAEKLVGLTAMERGLILVSSPPASGLTTTFEILVQSADRLLRDFISLEDAAAPPREIQNVKPVPFDARTGVTPLDALEGVLRSYPNVIVTRDVRDKALVVELVKLAGQDKLVILSLKASDAADAIARILACGVPPQLLATTLVGSLGQRLIRKLCPKCREDYPPPAELLARLRLTPEQLPHIRRPSQHGCRACGGTGYLGRTAIYELASGATVRKEIAGGGDIAGVRKAALQDGMQQLRDAGMALVLEGVTSLQELQRVFAATGAAPVPAAKGASSK